MSEVECPVQYLCYYIGIGVGARFVACRFKRQPTKCHDDARMYMLSAQMSWKTNSTELSSIATFITFVTLNT